MHGNIDQMDKEQVMKEIERLQKEFPALQVNNTDAVLIESTAVDVTKQDK